MSNKTLLATVTLIGLSATYCYFKDNGCSQLTNDKKHNIACAISESRRAISNPILADLTAAQAIHESGLHIGKPSKLAMQGNNLFGIKGQGSCGAIKLKTWEVLGGRKISVMADFAKYCTLADGMAAKAQLFDRPRYKNLYDSTSFEDAARRIYKSGYATDPQYTQHLITIYKLYIK